MNGPSLQKTTALSAALHLTVFAIAALILRQSQTVYIPSPYVVSLVAPVSSSQGRTTETAADREPPGTKVTEEKKQPEKAVKETKSDQKNITDQKRLEDRMTELAAKKKIERVARLRSVVSIKGNEGKGAKKTAGQDTGAGPSQGSLFDSYYAKITNQIRQEWVYPDTGEKDMEAVIAVKIAKDGSVNVQGIEKSSGNALFDRSALRAITKASPVMPPPYEMEIGMRFYP
jgi:colicin import membrane protein